jgi:hypothetical protein
MSTSDLLVRFLEGQIEVCDIISHQSAEDGTSPECPLIPPIDESVSFNALAVHEEPDQLD